MSIITSIRGLTSCLKGDETTSDNIIFQLHYKYTTILLVTFCMLVTAKQHFGDPIDCIGDENAVKREILDTYCWITTTYSNPDDWRKSVGTEVAYPGIANGQHANGFKPRVYHAYYQWVWFVLFVQALLFWVPRIFWKSIEADKIKSLMCDLHKPMIKPEERIKKCEILSQHLFDNRKNQGNLIFWYLVAEIMNLINVLGQMQLMHRFLGNKFWSIGIDFLVEEQNDDPVGFDSLMEVFPRMTKCTFHMYGPSGDVVKQDAFCLLSINNLNEKMYLIIWFWFITLAVITFCGIIYRLSSIFIRDIRIIVTQSRCPLINREITEKFIEELQVDEWFLLDRIGKNADGFNYKTLCEIHYIKFKRDYFHHDNIPLQKIENEYKSKEIKDTQC